MKHQDWDHMLDSLLSLVPFFYRKFMLTGDAVASKHMPPSHMQVLLLLHEHGTLTVSDIGNRLAISRPNMTPLLNKLIEETLVERHYSSQDRRVILVSLTEAGMAFVAHYKELTLSKLQESLAVLPDDEKEQLASSLETVRAILSKLPHKR